MKFQKTIRRLAAILLIAAVAAILAGGAAAAAFRSEAERLSVNEFDLEFPGWTGKPLRVALLADIHVDPSRAARERLAAIVDETNRQKPDLVLLLGDYGKGHRPDQSAPPAAIAAELGKLSAPLGVWAVLGNHDHWQDAEKIRYAFEEQGIRFLEDERIILESEGHSFHLAGAIDLWKQYRPDWERLLPPEEESGALLVMTHSPDVFATLPDRPLVAVAGHTHGGQIRLPFVGAPAVPSEYGERYARGVIREGKRTIYVTTGLGTSIVPWRFDSPPEIALIRLRAPEKK